MRKRSTPCPMPLPGGASIAAGKPEPADQVDKAQKGTLALAQQQLTAGDVLNRINCKRKRANAHFLTQRNQPGKSRQEQAQQRGVDGDTAAASAEIPEQRARQDWQNNPNQGGAQ